MEPCILEGFAGGVPAAGFPRAEAAALQSRLAGRVVLEDAFPDPLRTVAGVDVSVREVGGAAWAFACIAVLEWGTWKILRVAVASRPVDFPYIPGLLSFRELPVILEAARELPEWPGLFLVDGAGRGHPRFFGIACHLGLATGRPAVGVAKSRLVGVRGPVPAERGSQVPLLLGNVRVGTVLRTRAGVRPLYVSPGHLVSVPSSAGLVMGACSRYRLPEPVRLAHRLAGEAGRSYPSRFPVENLIAVVDDTEVRTDRYSSREG